MLRLDVYLEGVDGPVGTLDRAPEGELSFQYRTDALPHPISQSLPVSDAPYPDTATRGFFENLLFENAIRDQVMQKYGLAFSDVAGLLFHLGRDCPGAISVVPQGEAPAKQPGNLAADYDPLSEEDLTRIMAALRDHQRMPEATNDPSPLAGVQGKLALTLLPDGRYALPRAGRGAPTTHILKVPRANQHRLVDHEQALMQIAGGVLDHPVAQTRILGTGDLRGLLVTRFDREVRDGQVHRIHQEDFCQALGLGPALKYQRDGAGARTFSTARVGALLAACDAPARARLAFFEGTLVNLLLGNTDNHAKNHGLLYRGDRPDRPHLAPFYDIVPTVIDPMVTHQLSFDLGAAQMTDEITRNNLAAFATDLGMRGLTAPLRDRVAAQVAAIVDLIPQQTGPAHKRLGDAMAEQANRLARALDLDLAVPERDLIVINRP